jgi:hypothetical protein
MSSSRYEEVQCLNKDATRGFVEDAFPLRGNIIVLDGPDLNSTKGLLIRSRNIWVVEGNAETFEAQLDLRDHLAQSDPLWNRVRIVHHDMAEFIGIFKHPIAAVYADLMSANIEDVDAIVCAMQVNRCETDSFRSPLVFATTFAGRSRRGRTVRDRIHDIDVLCEHLGDSSQGVMHWGYSRQDKSGSNMMFNIHIINRDREEVHYRPRIVRRNVMHDGRMCHKVKWYGFSGPNGVTYEPVDFLD